MGLTSFNAFCKLPQRFKPQSMGFACDIGTINRLSARMGLAKSFQGIQLDGYKEATVRGYNALFRVFLTHSALECFCKVYGYSTKWKNMRIDIAPVIERHQSIEVLRLFRERDNRDKLYIFLQRHLTDEVLKKDLKDCKDGTFNNVAAVSAAIRHVFAHGVLTANANDMNPRAAHEIGTAVANFVFNVIDAEFSRTVEAYCENEGIAP